MEESNIPKKILDHLFEKCPAIFVLNEISNFCGAKNMLAFKVLDGQTPFRGWVHIEERGKDNYKVKLLHENLMALEIITDFEIENITWDGLIDVMLWKIW
jgi:hypothetical protein